jgi:hypothetical protein
MRLNCQPPSVVVVRRHQPLWELSVVDSDVGGNGNRWDWLS